MQRLSGMQARSNCGSGGGNKNGVSRIGSWIARVTAEVRLLKSVSIFPSLRSISAVFESILCVVDLEACQKPKSQTSGSVEKTHNIQKTSVQGQDDILASLLQSISESHDFILLPQPGFASGLVRVSSLPHQFLADKGQQFIHDCLCLRYGST